jgi:hypothetical protein
VAGFFACEDEKISKFQAKGRSELTGGAKLNSLVVLLIQASGAEVVCFENSGLS